MEKTAFFRYTVDTMNHSFRSIGYISTDAESVPRFYTISEIEGTLVLENEFIDGLSDIQPGEKLIVVFVFHRSPEFDSEHMRVTPPSRRVQRGVFSTRSPVRPNPIGVSEVEVTEVDKNLIYVRGLDMHNGSPILDIKPVQ